MKSHHCELTSLIVASCKRITDIIGFACANRTVIVDATICVDAACSNAWVYTLLSLTTLIDWTF